MIMGKKEKDENYQEIKTPLNITHFQSKEYACIPTSVQMITVTAHRPAHAYEAWTRSLYICCWTWSINYLLLDLEAFSLTLSINTVSIWRWVSIYLLLDLEAFSLTLSINTVSIWRWVSIYMLLDLEAFSLYCYFYNKSQTNICFIYNIRSH